MALAAAAAYTQVIGALLLIGGLLTPLAASGLASTMAVASIELIGGGAVTDRSETAGNHC